MEGTKPPETNNSAVSKLLVAARNSLTDNTAHSWPVIENIKFIYDSGTNSSYSDACCARVSLEISTCTGKVILVDCSPADARNICTLVWRFEAKFTPSKNQSTTPFIGGVVYRNGRCNVSAKNLLIAIFARSPADTQYFRLRRNIAALRDSVKNYSNAICRHIARQTSAEGAMLGLSALECGDWASSRPYMRGSAPLNVLTALVTVGACDDPEIAAELTSKYDCKVRTGRIDEIFEFGSTSLSRTPPPLEATASYSYEQTAEVERPIERPRKPLRNAAERAQEFLMNDSDDSEIELPRTRTQGTQTDFVTVISQDDNVKVISQDCSQTATQTDPMMPTPPYDIDTCYQGESELKMPDIHLEPKSYYHFGVQEIELSSAPSEIPMQ